MEQSGTKWNTVGLDETKYMCYHYNRKRYGRSSFGSFAFSIMRGRAAGELVGGNAPGGAGSSPAPASTGEYDRCIIDTSFPSVSSKGASCKTLRMTKAAV